MNADDLLRDAVVAEVDEILNDNLTPEAEVQRLTSIVATIFWDYYNTRIEGTTVCPQCDQRYPEDELTEVDGGLMCPSCEEVYRLDQAS